MSESKDTDSSGHLPTSEVGSEHDHNGGGPNGPEQSVRSSVNKSDMDAFMWVIRGLANGCKPQTATTLVKFDPDENDADIEGWCRINEVIIKHKEIKGTDLLLCLTKALRGRAATCLMQMSPDNITWESVKEHLIARFAKPMLMQDYFERVITFKTKEKESASDAAIRLWHLIESIPRVDMNDEAITGFAIAVLSRVDYNIRRELHSHNITNKSQLCRVLRGISLKRHNDDTTTHIDNKRPRLSINPPAQFTGICHLCGEQGHKIINCPKTRVTSSQIRNKLAPPCLEEKRSITCFACGAPGHVANVCPARSSSPMIVKEGKLCGKRAVTGELHVADE